MAILLMCWVCGSTALCVAFLCVAVRPAPPMGDQVASGFETGSTQKACALESVGTGFEPTEARLESPFQAA